MGILDQSNEAACILIPVVSGVVPIESLNASITIVLDFTTNFLAKSRVLEVILVYWPPDGEPEPGPELLLDEVLLGSSPPLSYVLELPALVAVTLFAFVVGAPPLSESISFFISDSILFSLLSTLVLLFLSPDNRSFISVIRSVVLK